MVRYVCYCGRLRAFLYVRQMRYRERRGEERKASGEHHLKELCSMLYAGGIANSPPSGCIILFALASQLYTRNLTLLGPGPRPEADSVGAAAELSMHCA